MAASGKLFLVSAPSGAGKTTIVRKILDRFDTLTYSISHTTRPPRSGEVDGVDYFFISEQAFKQMIEASHWLEWANVHGNYYGTSKQVVENSLNNGSHILLDIDVQGAKQIMASGLKPVSIFIMPPSFEALENRLRSRGTDSSEVIEKRLKNAQMEIKYKDMYDHILINDDLDTAVIEMVDLLKRQMA
jgi:guanylate kinase